MAPDNLPPANGSYIAKDIAFGETTAAITKAGAALDKRISREKAKLWSPSQLPAHFCITVYLLLHTCRSFGSPRGGCHEWNSPSKSQLSVCPSLRSNRGANISPLDSSVKDSYELSDRSNQCFCWAAGKAATASWCPKVRTSRRRDVSTCFATQPAEAGGRRVHRREWRRRRGPPAKAKVSLEYRCVA